MTHDKIVQTSDGHKTLDGWRIKNIYQQQSTKMSILTDCASLLVRLEDDYSGEFSFDRVGQMGQRLDVQQLLVDGLQVVGGTLMRPLDIQAGIK
jgi:hypothetical protein